MKKWDLKEEGKLVELFKSGKNYKELGEKLERGERSVREKLRRLGYGYLKDGINKIKNYVKINCKFCSIEFESLKRDNRIFCDHSCAAAFNNTGIIRNNKKYCSINYCKNCSSVIKNNKKYCDNNCQGKYERKIIFKKIENGDTTLYVGQYKKYLIEKYGNKCMVCGWNEIHPTTGNVPIQLEHKDGNSKNNNLNNLELLCPNHHSLTLTFGNLNKGNGRNERQTYREHLKKLTIEELIEEKIKK